MQRKCNVIRGQRSSLISEWLVVVFIFCCVLCISTSERMRLTRGSRRKTKKNEEKSFFFKDLVASSGLYFHVFIFFRGYIAGCMICCFTSHSRQTRLHGTLDTVIYKRTFLLIFEFFFHCFRPCECMHKHVFIGRNTQQLCNKVVSMNIVCFILHML